MGDSVKLALSILKGFYSKAFVQTGKYVPPNSDRDGNTVGDLAPEVFDDKYHGAQAESKGIVGILEVILSDFDRTTDKTKKDETESEDAFKTFEKDTKDDVSAKEGTIEKHKSDISDAESEILDQEKGLKDAKELLESAKDKLAELEPMCVKGEETW